MMTETMCQYDRLRTCELVERVAEHGDESALRELVQNRRAFVWEGKKRLNLAEYVRALCETLGGRFPAGVLDYTYETTIDRFHNLPRNESHDFPGSRIDCRKYYRALLAQFHEGPSGAQTSLELDVEHELFFQQFVVRHFYFSLKEAKRRCNTRVHRYAWNVDGQKIVLIMPRSMAGEEKRNWLSDNVDTDVLTAPEAQRLVQAIVDEKLLRALTSGAGHRAIDELESGPDTSRWSFDHEVSSKGLATAMADEKTSIIDQLRPSIRRLGRDRLRGLILDVFQGLEQGGYDEGRLAAQYGLSKSSFSRFCGGRWEKPSNGACGPNIPDLWVNFAGLLSASTRFREAAEAAGVWGTVKTVSDFARKNNGMEPRA